MKRVVSVFLTLCLLIPFVALGEGINGLHLDEDGVFRLYRNGEPDLTSFGIVQYGGGRFFVANGEIVRQDGLISDGEHWYFVSQGQVANYTGLALYDHEWFYIVKGLFDPNRNGLVKDHGRQFVVAAGRLVRGVNGLWQNTDGVWYYLIDSRVATEYTGPVEYDGSWFDVVKGKLAIEPSSDDTAYDVILPDDDSDQGSDPSSIGTDGGTGSVDSSDFVPDTNGIPDVVPAPVSVQDTEDEWILPGSVGSQGFDPPSIGTDGGTGSVVGSDPVPDTNGIPDVVPAPVSVQDTEDEWILPGSVGGQGFDPSSIGTDGGTGSADSSDAEPGTNGKADVIVPDPEYGIEPEPLDPIAEAFVTHCYRTALGREPDAEGLNRWARDLMRNNRSARQIARSIALSGEAASRNLSNAEFVTMLYALFMGRTPDEAGLQAWLMKLDAGEPRESVVDGFVNAGECASYFSSFGY